MRMITDGRRERRKNMGYIMLKERIKERIKKEGQRRGKEERKWKREGQDYRGMKAKMERQREGKERKVEDKEKCK